MAVALPRQQWAKHFDPWVPLLALFLCMGSVVMIHSAQSPPGSVATNVIKQVVGILLGFGAFVYMARTDYRAVMSSSRWLYTANLILLVLVMVPGIGDESLGAQRWIKLGPLNLQPSEIAKVLLILTLGAFLERNRATLDQPHTLVRSLLHMAFPMLLIFKQPDLGTSLVLVSAWFAMTFVAGARVSHLAAIAALGLTLFSVGWATGIIKDYQKQRLIVFLNPEHDTSGAGYQLYRSKVAVGSGQVFGKGLFKGDMKRLKYVPERHTDFIFTVVAEELGFVGSASLIGIYLLLIIRIIMTVLRSEDPLGQIIGTGVAAMFTFHTIVNVGMTIGVMPITGVPLPLFSYGPSAIIASLAALGLVESVHLRRHKISF